MLGRFATEKKLKRGYARYHRR